MRYAIAGTAAAVIVAGSLVAACSSPQRAPDPAACKAAMAKAYATALRNPSGKPAAEPQSCKGLPAATVSQYATQIMEGH